MTHTEKFESLVTLAMSIRDPEVDTDAKVKLLDYLVDKCDSEDTIELSEVWEAARNRTEN